MLFVKLNWRYKNVTLITYGWINKPGANQECKYLTNSIQTEVKMASEN